MINWTHHFDMDGVDIYAALSYDEGQEQTYDQPYIAPHHEVYAIWVGLEKQPLEYGSLWDAIELLIHEEIGEPL